jgi:hypothetical protein
MFGATLMNLIGIILAVGSLASLADVAGACAALA